MNAENCIANCYSCTDEPLEDCMRDHRFDYVPSWLSSVSCYSWKLWVCSNDLWLSSLYLILCSHYFIGNLPGIYAYELPVDAVNSTRNTQTLSTMTSIQSSSYLKQHSQLYQKLLRFSFSSPSPLSIQFSTKNPTAGRLLMFSIPLTEDGQLTDLSKYLSSSDYKDIHIYRYSLLSVYITSHCCHL